MEFHEYETIYNTDINNKFQYTEFDEYKESETVEIDIPKSINQNMFTESSIEPFTEAQDIDFHNVSPKSMNTSITSHCSEYNQQLTYHWEDKFYYDSVHKIETLQHIVFIPAVTLPVNGDLKNLHKIIVYKDWLLFQNAINQKINSHWKCTIYEKVSQSSIPARALLLTSQWVHKIKHNQESKPVKYKACWVIYSYKQQKNIDFYETFALIVHTNLWKLILVLCIIYGLYIHHYNIVMTFLNKVLDELLYMQYSTEYEIADYILRLLKALYSLKQIVMCMIYTPLWAPQSYRTCD